MSRGSGAIRQGGHYGIPVGRAPKGGKANIGQGGYPNDLNVANPVGNGAGKRGGIGMVGGNPVGGRTQSGEEEEAK